MSFSDLIFQLAEPWSGRRGLSGQQIIDAVQAAIGSPNMVYCSGGFLVDGAPDVFTDSTLTIGDNFSGFSLQNADTELVFPSTGRYLAMLRIDATQEALAVADVNTAVVCPGAELALTVGGAGAASCFIPSSYTVTPASGVATFSIAAGFSAGVGNVGDTGADFLQVLFRNRVFDTTSMAIAGSFIVIKLRS